jgi:hypothetical protein
MSGGLYRLGSAHGPSRDLLNPAHNTWKKKPQVNLNSAYTLTQALALPAHHASTTTNNCDATNNGKLTVY